MGSDNPFIDESKAKDPFNLGWETNDVEVEENKEEMCDHEEHKEVVTQQEMRGGNALGVGGQFETSEALIVCKKCGDARAVDRLDDGGGPMF